jgi:single-strand DNA-binding protein
VASEASKAKPKLRHKYRNQVEIVGRLSKTPEEKTLPSGDLIVELRVVVERDDRDGVDTLDVVTWRAQLRRRCLKLKPDEWVRVKGVIRRRFWKSGTTVGSRWQVEARELERV